MKILFAIPSHLKTVPMGQFSAEALRELGHQVVVFDYHARLGDRLCDCLISAQEEKPAMNRRFRKAAEDENPDLMLTLFGFDLSVQSLASLRAQGIPSACWWINDPFQFQRSLPKAQHYDFLFSNSAGCVKDYHAAGVANAHFLPTACQPGVRRPVAPVEEYHCDICFAGDWSSLREKILLRLVQNFDVKIFGPWKKKLAADSPLLPRLCDGFFTPAQMAQMFSSAKVVLNIHTWFETHDHGLNPHLFEAAGCGTFQAVDWKREIPLLFDCGSELFCYHSLDELTNGLGEFLADDNRRRAMAQATRRRALAEHTYRHRMSTLLETIHRSR